MSALGSIRRRVERACQAAGRASADVAIVGASKRQPLDRLHAVYDQGLRCFGENRVQEAEDKQPALPGDIDWHLIGPLQSNKVRRAVACFSTIHSVDRLKIARALDRAAADAGKEVDAFLQVNIGDEPSKHGFGTGELRTGDLLAELLATNHVRWRGLMAIPPPEDDPDRARRWFRALRELRDELRLRNDRIGADLSMGMSSDFEIAIEEGSTHVRLGSILFGARPVDV